MVQTRVEVLMTHIFQSGFAASLLVVSAASIDVRLHRDPAQGTQQNPLTLWDQPHNVGNGSPCNMPQDTALGNLQHKLPGWDGHVRFLSRHRP